MNTESIVEQEEEDDNDDEQGEQDDDEVTVKIGKQKPKIGHEPEGAGLPQMEIIHEEEDED